MLHEIIYTFEQMKRKCHSKAFIRYPFNTVNVHLYKSVHYLRLLLELSGYK